jgi:type IV pilus assembly protein PilA
MLRSRLRRRAANSDGFTLVEMLVVVLIIGVLMSIGVAAFLNQRSKAQDSKTKLDVTTAAKAMQVYSTERDSYAGATPAALMQIEAALGEAAGLDVESTASTFKITVDSAAKPGATFSIERTAAGELIRTCSLPGTGSCLADADALGNRW